MKLKTLFRGISTKYDNKIYFGMITFNRDPITKVISYFIMPDGMQYPCISIFVDRDSIAMNTGLKDSNGVDIYGSIDIDGEMTRGGDVIGSDYPHRHDIKYNNQEAAFVAVKSGGDYCPVFQKWVDDCSKVIIGNEYQNPELLK